MRFHSRLIVAGLGLAMAAACLPASSAELFEAGSGRTPRWASFENPTAGKGAAARENQSAKGHAFDALKAGQSVVLMQHAGPGVVRRIWITLNDRSPEMLRSLVLSMYWENEPTPAVQVPLGDFFAVSHGETYAFQSEVFSNPEGRSFNCIVPMPFRRAARIVLSNESTRDVPHLFYDVDFELCRTLPRRTLYFHCYWSRVLQTRVGEDYVVLPRVRGRGRFLGMSVGVMANPVYEDSWWGEGEVKMYLDGDTRHPTLAGTGTEDYAGTAWGLGRFAQRFQGCPVADPARRMWSFYRFHIPDPVYFEKDIEVTLQAIGGTGNAKILEFLKKGVALRPVSIDANGKFTRLLETGAPKLTDPDCPQGWVNFQREDDYCAAAYFYLDQPSHRLPPLPPLAVRTAKLKPAPAP